jgi:hypothetical protein
MAQSMQQLVRLLDLKDTKVGMVARLNCDYGGMEKGDIVRIIGRPPNHSVGALITVESLKNPTRQKRLFPRRVDRL